MDELKVHKSRPDLTAAHKSTRILRAATETGGEPRGTSAERTYVRSRQGTENNKIMKEIRYYYLFLENLLCLL